LSRGPDDTAPEKSSSRSDGSPEAEAKRSDESNIPHEDIVLEADDASCRTETSIQRAIAPAERLEKNRSSIERQMIEQMIEASMAPTKARTTLERMALQAAEDANRIRGILGYKQLLENRGIESYKQLLSERLDPLGVHGTRSMSWPKEVLDASAPIRNLRSALRERLLDHHQMKPFSQQMKAFSQDQVFKLANLTSGSGNR
jgi:hypothetical protein